MIIIPQNKFVDSDGLQIGMRMEGIFTLRAKSRLGTVRRERRFKNLITNLGLDRFGAFTAEFTYGRCHVGTGTATPQFTDTQLSSYHGTVQNGVGATSRGVSDGPDYFYGYFRTVWTSAVGALGNVILTEIGVAGQQANGLLFSRALILDGSGNPTSFPLSSDEQLEVTYELRLYRPTADVEGSITVGSSSHDFIARPLQVTSSTAWSPVATGFNTTLGNSPNDQRAWSGGLAAITAANPGGTALGSATSRQDGTYTNGDHYIESGVTYGPATANGSIQSTNTKWGCCTFQTQFSPPIVKNNTQSLRLNYRLSWGRR